MATEKYSIGYDEGYQDGWNAAIDETIKQEQGEPAAWRYSFTHSSAIGHGDYDIGPLVTDKKDVAFGVGCFNQEPLYTHPQPKQEQGEPVAWMYSPTGALFDICPNDADEGEFLPLYTTPPQRTWVGLTDEDIEQEFGFIDELLRDCVQRTEAKLKDKNI